MAHVMSSALVSKICKDKGYYRSPELNEQLFLHFQGFPRINGLEEFINCKVLWLENNSIEVIEGLSTLTALSCLYLQNNCLRSLLRATCSLPSVRSINLSNNYLTSLEGLVACVPNVEKLIAAHNELTDIDEVARCPSIYVLDVSHNRITDADRLLASVAALPRIATLVLQGNDFSPRPSPYRKTVVARLPELKYLDEYPVFEDERRCASAWAAEGTAGEKRERERIKAEDAQRLANQRQFFDDFVRDAASRGPVAPNETRDLHTYPDTPYFATMKEVEEARLARVRAHRERGRQAGGVGSSDDADGVGDAADDADDADGLRPYVPKVAVSYRDRTFGDGAKPKAGRCGAAPPRAAHADPMRGVAARAAVEAEAAEANDCCAAGGDGSDNDNSAAWVPTSKPSSTSPASMEAPNVPSPLAPHRDPLAHEAELLANYGEDVDVQAVLAGLAPPVASAIRAKGNESALRAANDPQVANDSDDDRQQQREQDGESDETKPAAAMATTDPTAAEVESELSTPSSRFGVVSVDELLQRFREASDCEVDYNEPGTPACALSFIALLALLDQSGILSNLPESDRVAFLAPLEPPEGRCVTWSDFLVVLELLSETLGLGETREDRIVATATAMVVGLRSRARTPLTA